MILDTTVTTVSFSCRVHNDFSKKKGKRGPRVKVVVEAIPTDRVTRNTARVST